jgi:hypothetical protein
MNTNLEHKTYLFNRAKDKVGEFNQVIISIRKQLGDLVTDEQIATLQTLFSELENKSKNADRAHGRYLEYCNDNNYTAKNIDYATPYLYHSDTDY